MVGEAIEHYKILQRLGEGGMGTVYRALDTMLEREVAIKLLRTDLSDQPDVTQRFRAEAVALARLSHPHIATLFGLVRHQSQLCMVMELVRGETLAFLMKQERGFPCDRAVRLAMQILGALDYAHESGIVHRDVKPSNVIVAPSGVAKVLDFGIARVLDSDRMTRQGLIVGTPQYMAPEQIRGEEIDGRADVYGVGVLLYEMIAGRLPYVADTGVGIMYATLEGTATPLSEVAPHAPPWLVAIIHRALTKSPQDRFTAGELRSALDEGLSAEPVARAQMAAAAVAVAPAVAGGLSIAALAPSLAPSEVRTALQPTMLHSPARSEPARSESAAPSAPAESTDVLRERETEPYPAELVQPARPSSRTWAMAAGALAIVALAGGAIWLRQTDASTATAPAARPVEALTPARADSLPATPRSAPARRTAAPVRMGGDRSVPDKAAPDKAAPDKAIAAAAGAAAAAPIAKPEVSRESAVAPADAASASRVVAPAPDAPPPVPGAVLAPASFDDLVLLVPADKGREEVEVRVTFHPERFVVFDLDAGRIVWQVFYRERASKAASAVLLGTPRLITGSERWFVLPTTAGEIVLRLDLDASGDIVSVFETQSGMRASRVKGELGG